MKTLYTTVLLLLVSSVSFANNELQAIHDEVASMKQQYENKITALETRLAAAEQTIKQQSQDIEDTNQQATEQEVVASTSETANPNTFNPAISVIFDGRYVIMLTKLMA